MRSSVLRGRRTPRCVFAQSPRPSEPPGFVLTRVFDFTLQRFGETLRKQYPALFPDKDYGREHKKGDDGKEKGPKTPFKVRIAPTL